MSNRKKSRPLAKTGFVWLILSLMILSMTGASCPRRLSYLNSQTPAALPPTPTLAKVIEVVNRNSDAIRTVSTDRASISTPETPSLRAQLAISRPGNVRVIGETTLTGREVDLGSNEELFWFWAKRDPNHSVYYCRHDRFSESQAGRMLPITPDQLVEAIGLVRFDPALPHHGPTRRADGALEIRTVTETETGTNTRVTVVDPHSGWVLGQSIYDSRDQIVFQSTAKDHRRDPLTGLVLPRTVRISVPANRFDMTIDLGNVDINTLSASRNELFTMPQFPNARLVDLASPSVRFTPVSTSMRTDDRTVLSGKKPQMTKLSARRKAAY
jgi:hypothetical protein